MWQCYNIIDELVTIYGVEKMKEEQLLFVEQAVYSAAANERPHYVTLKLHEYDRNLITLERAKEMVKLY